MPGLQNVIPKYSIVNMQGLLEDAQTATPAVTVKTLQAQLRGRGLDTSGLKQQLLKRLENAAAADQLADPNESQLKREQRIFEEEKRKLDEVQKELVSRAVRNATAVASLIAHVCRLPRVEKQSNVKQR